MSLFSSKKDANVPRRRRDDADSRARETSEPGFRRNQTLRSSRLPSSNALPSDRNKAHRLVSRQRRIGAILGLVLLIIGLLFLLLSQFTARVVVTGASQPLSRPLDTTRYEQYVTDYLGINPVERFRFVLNDKALSDYVASRSPEIASVRLSGVAQLTDSRFSVDLRQPVAGWQINNSQLYVDNRGVVFSENFFDIPSVQIVDQSGISPEQGTAVASTRLLSFVGLIVTRAGESNLTVSSASLPTGTTRQVEVRLKDVVPFVRFTIDREAGEQVEDMNRVLRFLQTQGQSAEYIDVRVQGRAVYR